MANKNSGSPGNEGWEDVLGQYERQSGSRRHGPSSMVHPTGLTFFNVESSELLEHVVKKAGIDAKEFSVRYRVNAQKGLVAVLPADETEDGKVAVVKHGDVYSLHLGMVFERYPKVRPHGKRKCIVFMDSETGYLTISLHTGKGVQTETRSGAEQQSSKQVAAASQPDEDGLDE